MTEFIQNREGVHIMHGEFTLCGDSFDIAETERGFEDGALVVTSKRTVTCPRCAAIILMCRGIRVSSSIPSQDGARK